MSAAATTITRQARAGTQSIDRAAQLLVRIVESNRPTSVTELAATNGLPKSTTLGATGVVAAISVSGQTIRLHEGSSTRSDARSCARRPALSAELGGGEEKRGAA